MRGTHVVWPAIVLMSALSSAGAAQSAGVTLHVETLYGENNHHIVESCYKGLARALRQAIALDPRKADAVPSTKGVLGGSMKA